jgi:hypothetical protein
MRKIIMLIFLIGILAYPVQAEMMVKSISCFPIISNFESLSKANCTINTVLNGGNHILIGEITGNSLITPFKLDISDRTETISYDRLNQGATYRFDIKYIDGDCPGKPAYCFLIKKGTLQIDRHGIYFSPDRNAVVTKVADGTYYRFGSPKITSKEKISISMNGTTQEMFIGSGDARGMITLQNNNEWIGKVQMLGYSMTGNDAPNQDNFVGTTKNGINKITYSTDFLEYSRSLDETDIKLSIYQEDKEIVYISKISENTFKNPTCKDEVCSKVLNLIDLHNSNLAKLQNKNINIGYQSATSGIIKTEIKPIAYDELLITIKADKLGIIVNTGKPEFVSFDVPECIEGDGYCQGIVKIKNIGPYEGAFEAFASGATGDKIILKPGATGEIKLFFNNITQGSYKGEIIVYEMNTGEEVKQNFSLNVISSKNFRPNETISYNSVTFETDKTGMYQNITENCEGKVIKHNPNTDKYDCFDVEKVALTAIPPQQGYPPMQQLQPIYPNQTNPESFYKWALIGVIAMVIILFLVSIISKGMKLKNLYGAGVIILLLALLSILLIYLYTQRIEIMELIKNIVGGELWNLL